MAATGTTLPAKAKEFIELSLEFPDRKAYRFFTADGYQEMTFKGIKNMESMKPGEYESCSFPGFLHSYCTPGKKKYGTINTAAVCCFLNRSKTWGTKLPKLYFVPRSRFIKNQYS